MQYMLVIYLLCSSLQLICCYSVIVHHLTGWPPDYLKQENWTAWMWEQDTVMEDGRYCDCWCRYQWTDAATDLLRTESAAAGSLAPDTAASLLHQWRSDVRPWTLWIGELIGAFSLCMLISPWPTQFVIVSENVWIRAKQLQKLLQRHLT